MLQYMQNRDFPPNEASFPPSLAKNTFFHAKPALPPQKAHSKQEPSTYIVKHSQLQLLPPTSEVKTKKESEKSNHPPSTAAAAAAAGAASTSTRNHRKRGKAVDGAMNDIWKKLRS